MQITNSNAGARGVNLKSGATVWIEPGETATFDKADIASIHADLEGEAGTESSGGGEKPLAKMNKTELLAAAADESIETVRVDDKDVPVADATNPQLVAAIEAKRAAA